MKKPWHENFKRASKLSRTDADGTTFHSRGELTRWKKLQLWQIAGEIRNLKRQVKFPLDRKGVTIKTPTGKVMAYTADFTYERKDAIMDGVKILGWSSIIEDYKGYSGRLEKLRIAIFEALYDVTVTISQ